jgi:hypothetical protein
MPGTSKKFLAAALLSAALVAQGQPLDASPWYKVELMVFSHQGGNDGAEQWEATPELRYPDRFRFLVEPDRVKQNLRANPGESSVDERGRQVIIRPAEPGADAPPVGGPEMGGIAGSEPDPNAPAARREATPPVTPTPFVALPAGERTFPSAYMRRSGRYDTLFHEAWYQPVRGEDEALPLILDRSGDTGYWPRLQGSVKLYLSRYLHIETNLWLNTDGRYLPGQWRMPAPPLGPPSLIIEYPATAESAAVIPTSPAGAAAEWPADGAFPGAPDPNAVEETGPQYPFRHAVLLQQNRRMRSKEVHYLDHPLLGVVLSFTPLSGEELEALALTEASLRGDRPGD